MKLRFMGYIVFLIFVFIIFCSKTAVSGIYIETIYILPYRLEAKKAPQEAYEQIVGYLEKIPDIENKGVNVWLVVSGSDEEKRLMVEANKKYRPPEDKEQFFIDDKSRAGKSRKVCLTTSVIKTKYMKILPELWSLMKSREMPKLKEPRILTWVVPIHHGKPRDDRVRLISENIEGLCGQMLINSDTENDIYFLFSNDYDNLLCWADELDEKTRGRLDDVLRKALETVDSTTNFFEKRAISQNFLSNSPERALLPGNSIQNQPENKTRLRAVNKEEMPGVDGLGEDMNCLNENLARASLACFPYDQPNKKHIGVMVMPVTQDVEVMTDFELLNDRYRALECPICFCRLPGIPVTTGCCNIDICSFSDLLRRNSSCPYGCGGFRELICFPRGLKDYGHMKVLADDGKCLSISIKFHKGRYYTYDSLGVRSCYQYEMFDQHFYLPPYNSNEKKIISL